MSKITLHFQVIIRVSRTSNLILQKLFLKKRDIFIILKALYLTRKLSLNLFRGLLMFDKNVDRIALLFLNLWLNIKNEFYNNHVNGKLYHLFPLIVSVIFSYIYKNYLQ